MIRCPDLASAFYPLVAFSVGRWLRGRLRLEYLVTLGERDPGLLAPGPDVPSWPQPRRIVEGARSDAHHPVSGRAANPRAAFGADPSRVESPAIGHALEPSRLDPAETKRTLRDDNPHGERAARQALAVARVDQLRDLGDFAADLAALAAAGLWKFHGDVSCRFTVDLRTGRVSHVAQTKVLEARETAY
jgi:hypothetical protein